MIIKDERKRRGWTQADLKSALEFVGVNVPIGSIGYIERQGTTDPKTAAALSRVLRVEIVAIDSSADHRRRRAIRAAIALLTSEGYNVTAQGTIPQAPTSTRGQS